MPTRPSLCGGAAAAVSELFLVTMCKGGCTRGNIMAAAVAQRKAPLVISMDIGRALAWSGVKSQSIPIRPSGPKSFLVVVGIALPRQIKKRAPRPLLCIKMA